MNDRVEVYTLPDAKAVAAEAAQRFATLAQSVIATGRPFTVALAGGSTPKAMYALLAEQPLHDNVLWDHVHFFWSDERFVAPDDAESNFRMARETLLDNIPIPAANVYPVPTIGGSPEAAAKAYAEMIRSVVGDAMRFDLVLLGMGPDGHTASLFPGRPEVETPPEPFVMPVYDSPKPPPTRLSFTLGLINAAANVHVLSTGAEKADAVRRALRPASGEEVPPVGRVRPTDGQLVWLLDAAAAQELS